MFSSCDLFYFYIKPQPLWFCSQRLVCCDLFYFYIKPQHKCCKFYVIFVVTYSISTSNHNLPLIQTVLLRLWLILFLHQTTTLIIQLNGLQLLWLILFLHQTTTGQVSISSQVGCDLFYFYIKPQLTHSVLNYFNVVTYSISTSNHNYSLDELDKLFVVTYSISTSNHNWMDIHNLSAIVVTYSISTSNHN